MKPKPAERELTFGHSPCPNDTFMFHAIHSGDVRVPGCRFRPVLHDVETLNAMAFEGALDVSKLSCFAWLAVRDRYRLLSTGAAMGFGCGPMLVARKPMAPADLARATVVLPGRWTTAHLLFRLFAPPGVRTVFTTYDKILSMVTEGAVDAGVIIHESRFTYADAGASMVVDLGAWWEAETGMPIPLGCIAARADLPDALHDQVDRALGESIRLAMEKPADSKTFIRTHARELDDAVLGAHIDTFVNAFSLDMGDQGRNALDVLAERAADAGVLP